MHLLLLLLLLLFLLIREFIDKVAPEVGERVLVVDVNVVDEAVGEVVHEILEIAEVAAVDDVVEIKVAEGVVRRGIGGSVVGGRRLFLWFLLHHGILKHQGETYVNFGHCIIGTLELPKQINGVIEMEILPSSGSKLQKKAPHS